jgi:hypothetical protein
MSLLALHALPCLTKPAMSMALSLRRAAITPAVSIARDAIQSSEHRR